MHVGGGQGVGGGTLQPVFPDPEIRRHTSLGWLVLVMLPLIGLQSIRLFVAETSSHPPVSRGTDAFGSPPLFMMLLFTTQLLLATSILKPSSGFPVEMLPMKLFEADASLMIRPLCLPAGSEGASMIGRLLSVTVLSWTSPNVVPPLARMPFSLAMTRF